MSGCQANEGASGLVPGWGGRISAGLVYDGTDEVRVPEAMGVPRADQMQGTARERLSEVALRVCYDSADAADAEIRLGFAEAVLPCLQASRYGDRFADLVLQKAADGIGRSLAGGGSK